MLIIPVLYIRNNLKLKLYIHTKTYLTIANITGHNGLQKKDTNINEQNFNANNVPEVNNCKEWGFFLHLNCVL